MKKQLSLSLVAAAVLLAGSASIAHSQYKGENYKGEAMPCPPQERLKDGFYVGLGVGYDAWSNRHSNAVTIDGTLVTANPTISSTGFVGSLFAGYGQVFNEAFYLGAEIFISDSAASNSYGVNTYNSKTNINTGWGISLLPGYKLNDATLFYIRLGYNQARIQVKENTAVAANSETNTSSGFNYGLGMETLLYQNWSLRGEYTHTNYSSFTTNVFNTKVSPSDNQFMLGLIYHFV